MMISLDVDFGNSYNFENIQHCYYMGSLVGS